MVERAEVEAAAEDRKNSAAEHQYPHRELTQAIIGAAYEVHNTLGPGFLEAIYHLALVRELRERGLEVDVEFPVHVTYKGKLVGTHVLDLVVEKAVVVEVKAVSAFSPLHEAQILSYLRATGLKVGLLVNFGGRRVEVKRLAM